MLYLFKIGIYALAQLTFQEGLVKKLGEADGDVGILHGVLSPEHDGRVDGGRAEELERLVDEDRRHRDDDEEDEADAEDLEGRLLDVEVPLHAVDVRNLAEHLQPVAELLTPEVNVIKHFLSEFRHQEILT